MRGERLSLRSLGTERVYIPLRTKTNCQMRHGSIMRRRMFTLCSGISLLICLASAGAWVRSELADEWFTAQRKFGGTDGCGTLISYAVHSTNGGLVLEWTKYRGHGIQPWPWIFVHDADRSITRSWTYPYYHYDSRGWHSHFQFVNDSYSPTPGEWNHDVALVVPYWAVVLLFLWLRSLWSLNWLRRSRAAALRRRGFDVTPVPPSPGVS